MKYTTYVSGRIDTSDLPKQNKTLVRSYLEEIYPAQEVSDIYNEDEIIIEDTWEEFETTEKFLITMFKIAKQLNKSTEALIMCNGERDGDIWGIIIKDNRVFTQRYELKPHGEPEEYEKARLRK